MFPTSKLFGLCPERTNCKRTRCLFSSHAPPAVPAFRPLPTPSTSSCSLKRPTPGPASEQTANKKVARTGSSGQPQASGSTSATTARTGGTAASGTVGGAAAAKAAQAAKVAQDLPATAGPPRLVVRGGITGHTPPVVRQKMLTVLYNQFLETYSPGILPTSLRHDLASRHALQQEETLFSRATKQTYRNACIGALARLKKRSPARSVEETGTLEEEDERVKKGKEEEKGRLTRERCGKYVASREKLILFDYMLEVPKGPGGDKETEEGNVQNCDRCKKEFVVKVDLSEDDRTACRYHYGRVVTEKVSGVRQRVWSCCPSVGAPPCQVGPHVFKDDSDAALHSRVPFVLASSLRSSISSSSTPLPTATDLAALDCELIYTTSGMSLARVTVLSSSGSLLLDEHIRPPPSSTVLDLNTRFSGVKEEDLEKAVLDVAGVRRAMAQFMDEKTILVGHGLENDLRALRLVYTQVIDTAILFPHPNGGTWRHALRNLTKDILGKFIQQDGPSVGHSAADDASAALELVRWKVKKEGG
ncbi:hypothetical protein JCM8547_008228 [Rhodosporidiobolus lusitaniae]